VTIAAIPPADVDITPSLVRLLLKEQHPELADLPLVDSGNGWDNKVYRLGDGLAVRLPRRSAGRITRRARTAMASRARTATAYRDPDSHPHGPSWMRISVGMEHHAVVRRGRARCRRRCATLTQRLWSLAAFVSALHLPAPHDAPRNPFRGVPLANRTPRHR
jgi:hypothetical protein